MRLSPLRLRAVGPVLIALLPTLPVMAADQDTETDPVTGIDVSHFNHQVDWGQVAAAGYTFAYVKATEGIDGADPLFAQNWRDAAAADLPRGAYHFYVTEDDPATQADFFIATVPCSDHGELIPVVDVEIVGHGTSETWVAGLQIFLDRVEAHFGVAPMIYTMPNFWNAKGGSEAYGTYRLWVAEYGVDAPRLPTGWSTWTLWQRTSGGTVPGVTKPTDLNRLADGLTLDAIRMPAPTTEPTIAPKPDRATEHPAAEGARLP